MSHQDNDPLLYSRDCEPTNLTCAMNINLLCRCTHMFHPPPPHPLPPEDEQLNSLFFFQLKHWKSRISIYLHSLSRCRAIGCQFSVSPTPTYSMGSVHKTACAEYSTLIITGSPDWKTDWKITLPWCRKFLWEKYNTALHLRVLL